MNFCFLVALISVNHSSPCTPAVMERTREIGILDFVINIPYVWNAVLIAFIGAILGALYPAFKAASKDPIDALAYE